MKHQGNIVVFGSGTELDLYVVKNLSKMGFMVNVLYGFHSDVRHINMYFPGQVSVFYANIDNCIEINGILRISDMVINLSDVNQDIEEVSSKILINFGSKYYEDKAIKKNIIVINQNRLDKAALNDSASYVSFSKIISKDDPLIRGAISFYKATGFLLKFESLHRNIKISVYKDVMDAIIKQLNAKDNSIIEADFVSSSLYDILNCAVKDAKNLNIEFIESKFLRYFLNKIPLFSFREFFDSLYHLSEIKESIDEKSDISNMIDILKDDILTYKNYV